MLERRRQERPEAQWRRLSRVAERLDGSERRRRLRALLVGGAAPRAEGVAGLVGLRSPWPALWELARGNAWRALRELRREIDPRTEPALTVVLLARACEAVGDVAGAEQVLRQAVTARPEEVVLLGALGRLLERQGRSRIPEVIGYYRAARSQRRHLGLALSRALIVAGKANEAEEVLRELALGQAHDHNPLFFYYLGAARIGQHSYHEAEAAYREAIRLKPGWARAYSNLGAALNGQQKFGEAEAACRKAIDLGPAFPEAYTNLGSALVQQGRPGEAEAACRKALDLRPDYAEAYTNLGNALVIQGQRAEAEGAYRKALDLRPDLAEAHHNLGNALLRQHRYAEAEGAYRRALDLRPDLAEAHCQLGFALYRQQNYGEAEAAYREAIRLKPGWAEAYSNFGAALNGQQKFGEGEAASRKALDLRPDFAEAYTNLGNALLQQGKPGEAEAACRRAIDLRPDFAEAYTNLGGAFLYQGKPDMAEAACRRALDLNSGLAEAHNTLGAALLVQKRYGEAEAAFRKATEFRPDFAPAKSGLGVALLGQARFDEAAAALKKAGALSAAGTPLAREARKLQRLCRRLVALDARLQAVLEGSEKPAGACEQMEFALLCALKQRYAAAARFWRDAFAAAPKRAEKVPGSLRSTAACAAALAGQGKGKDADRLDDQERARWRRQALDWFRQDLTGWGKALDRGNAQTRAQVRQVMQRWLTDEDLAGVRRRDALARLPDEERRRWQELWSDVEALLGSVSDRR
jgi:tetratricopeptide (TPR) repeat protein